MRGICTGAAQGLFPAGTGAQGALNHPRHNPDSSRITDEAADPAVLGVSLKVFLLNVVGFSRYGHGFMVAIRDGLCYGEKDKWINE